MNVINNRSKLILVSCTQKTKEEFKETPLGQSINANRLNLDACIYYENTNGMPQMYNQFIENEIKYLDSDLYSNTYVVFVHDDMYINDAFIHDKLTEGFKTFDILGLAGSNYFSIKREPCCWHNSPKESWSGSVMHPVKDGDDKNFIVTTFGPWPKEVIVLDGLFIAVNLNKLGDVRFDENFTFDFYDTSFGIRAHQAGLKLGTTPILCTHMSHGAGILKQSYKDAQAKFKQLYQKDK